MLIIVRFSHLDLQYHIWMNSKPPKWCWAWIQSASFVTPIVGTMDEEPDSCVDYVKFKGQYIYSCTVM